MPEDEQQQPNLPETPKHSGARRRGRRGGRGRSRPAPIAPVSQPPPENEFSAPQQEAPPQKPIFQPARRRGSPLLEAADEVAEIIESLKKTLAQMEKVLELTEIAERQKISDEHEIESLRRALRQLQSRRPQ